MKTKLLFIIGLACAALMLNGCHLLKDAVKGSGKAKTESRTVTAFSKVEVAGEGNVEITIGTTPSVEITTDDNLLPLITTKVDGDTLKIEQKKPLAPKAGVKIKIVTTSLTELAMAGSLETTIANLNEKSLKCTIAGSGSLKATGTATTQEFTVAGSGKFNCLGLKGEDVKVEVAGSGTANVSASKTLKVEIAGSGDVSYVGEPTIEKDIAGSGSVRKSE